MRRILPSRLSRSCAAVRRAAAVAGRDVEVAVGTEAEPAGLVVGGGGLVDGDDRRDARGIGDIRIRRHVIAADLGVAARIDQIDVEKAVAGEAGIEGEAEQAALAVRRGSGRTRRGTALPEPGPVARSRILICPVFSTMNRRPVSPGGAAANSGWLSPVATRVAMIAAGLALRSVRVKPVDEVRPGGALQRVAAVVAYDEIDGHECLRQDIAQPKDRNCANDQRSVCKYCDHADIGARAGAVPRVTQPSQAIPRIHDWLAQWSLTRIPRNRTRTQ